MVLIGKKSAKNKRIEDYPQQATGHVLAIAVQMTSEIKFAWEMNVCFISAGAGRSASDLDSL
jgi:hypothetical protein